MAESCTELWIRFSSFRQCTHSGSVEQARKKGESTKRREKFKTIWNRVTKSLRQHKTTSKYQFIVPRVNFSISYKLIGASTSLYCALTLFRVESFSFYFQLEPFGNLQTCINVRLHYLMMISFSAETRSRKVNIGAENSRCLCVNAATLDSSIKTDTFCIISLCALDRRVSSMAFYY